MNNSKSTKAVFITFLSLEGAITLAMIGYIIYGFIFSFYPLVILLSVIIYILLSIIFGSYVAIAFQALNTIKRREENNLRQFGVKTDFYDKSAFISSVNKKATKVAISQFILAKAGETALAQKISETSDEDVDVEALRDAIQVEIEEGNGKRLPHGAVIGLSIFSDSNKYQYYQSEQIKKFYGQVIAYFNELTSLKDNKNRIYAGFENNVFFIYFAYRSEQVLNKFLAKVESNLYKLFETSKVSVNMHPSFGIYKIDGKQKDIYKMVDNCLETLKSAISSFQVFAVYDEKLTDENTHSDELEQEIRRGLEKGEFKVYYQGKFDLVTDKFVGAEALIRWQHPTKGLFNPSAFIGESEKSGLIHMLDFYVFDQVCKDLGDWKKRGRRMLPISVNFSSYDFYRPDFVESVLTIIDKNGIAPNYIEIEVTESSAATNFYYVMSVLNRLKENNINILMDDFGTGFSSLGNLKKYPISALKIDKSFIDEMQEDVKSKQIVATIIGLCHSLGIQSVAEGVQTEAQVTTLRNLKCSEIQGYYYCKPISKKDFEVFLSTNKFEKKGMLL